MTSSTNASPCISCQQIAARTRGDAPNWDAIHRRGGWDIAHHSETSLLGWLVLTPLRHFISIDEMTDVEGHMLSILMRETTGFLKRDLGCTKTYIMQFAEHPGHPHVHFHVVPRMPDLAETAKGPNIFQFNDRTLAAVPLPDEVRNAFATRMRREFQGR